MDVEAFLKTTDRQFAEPCLRLFQFLEDKHGFQVNGSSVANEITMSYQLGLLRVNIGFAVPAEIYVSIQQTVNGKIIKDRFWKPKTVRYKQLASALAETRSRFGLDMWTEEFRKGTFNSLIESILVELASGIRKELLRLLSNA